MILRYIFGNLAYWGIVYLVALPLFPITYFIKAKRGNPIWWLQHHNPIGHPWYWTKFKIPMAKKGEKQKEPKGIKRFWIALNYSVLRNGCWRLFTHGFLKQPHGDKTDVVIKKHESYDGKNLSVFTVLRLKFKSNGIESDNVGDTVDLDKTYQGKNYVVYKIKGKKYFLYSYCKVGKKAKERTYGWNGSRLLIRRKTHML